MNTNIQDIPRSRDLQADMDYQERRLRGLKDTLTLAQSELGQMLADGPRPARIVSTGEKSSYDTELASVMTNVTAALTDLKQIDVLLETTT